MKKIYKKLLSSILLFVLVFSNMFNAAMFSSYGLEQNSSNSLKVQTALSKLISRYENFDGSYNEKYDSNESLGARNAGIDILQIRKVMNTYSTFSMSNASRATLALIAAGYNPCDYNGKDYSEIIKSKFTGESDPKDLATAILALDMTKADYDEDTFVKQLIATGKKDWSGEFAFGNSSRYWDDWDQDWVEDYTPSPEYTAIVVLALSKHKDVEGANETIDKCIAYLKKNLKDNGTVDNSLSSTIYTVQALRSLSVDPYTSSDWISSDSKTLLDGVLECYIEDKGRFANSSSSTYPAQMADSAAFLFLSEEVNNSSVYNLKYITPGDPSYIKTSLADSVDSTEDEVIKFSAYAYDSNNLPLETTLNILPEDTAILSVDSDNMTMKKAGTTKLVISAEGFDSVKKEITVNIKALNGLSKEKKAKLQSEINFLKDKYAVYNNYEFLSSPAASLSSMDKEHIKSNLMKYSKVNNLALLTKTAISMIGAGLDPREFTLDGENKNLIDELKASQIKSGDRKGQFALNPMDFDEAEYQAWAIITLYSANASYDSDAAIDALIKLLDGDYKKSTAYKGIQTEGVCLTALGLYRDDSSKAAAKADDLISWLMGMQNEDGGFNLDGGYFANSPMATASVVQGLMANGINPMYNPNWVKNEKTPLDSLLKCKYQSSDVRLQGYAKSEEKIGADYKATYNAFGALVDMLNDESMFKLIRMSPVSVTPASPAKIAVFGGFKSDAEINTTQYIDAFLFDSNGNLVSQKPSMKILDTTIATISGNEFKALKQGSTQLELKYGSLIKTIDISISDPAPVVDPDKDKVVLEDKEAYIVVRVEGNQGTISSQQIKYTFTEDSTPFDILKTSIGEENIGYEGSHGSEFINSILGESKGVKDGWSYCMKNMDGEIVQPMIGVNALKELRNDKNEIIYDEFIFYKSYFEETSDHQWLFHTKTPEIKVSINGNEVSVNVKDKADKSPLEGVVVSSNVPDALVLATTDSNGSATFTLDENKTYYLTFTRYEGGYATLLKMYRKIEIDSYLNDDLIKTLSIKSSSNKIKVGDTLKLETLATTKSGSDIDDLMVKWSSSKNNIAKVDQNGLITALNSGNTVIKAVYESVYSETYKQDGYLFDDFNLEVYEAAKYEHIDLNKAVNALRSYTLKQDDWNYEQALFYKMTGDTSDNSTIYSKIKINNEIKNPTDLAGNIISLVAADLNPYNYKGRNYVAELIALQQSNGSFKLTADTDNQTVLSAIALDMAEASYDRVSALSYLASKQNQDGSIGFGEDDTGMYLVLLADSNKYSLNRDLAVGYLRSKQLEDGIINNAYSTAWIIHGLIAIDEDPSSDSWTKENSLTDAFMSHFEDDHFKVVSKWGTDITFISKQAPLSVAELVSKKSAYKTVKSAYKENINVNTDSIAIEVGKTATITASINDTVGNPVSGKTPVFKSSDSNIASVDSNGLVSAIKSGSATITVSHPDDSDINALVSISVTKNPASILIEGPEGQILSKTEIEINENDNVVSFTKRALDNSSISYDIDSSGYVKSIAGFKEMQYGKNSGWKFYVNGETPNVGAASIKVTKSMNIEWRYFKEDEPNNNTAFFTVNGPEGSIVSKTEINIDKNDDVMSFTKRALDNSSISYDIDSSGYVKSIAGFKEMQYGKNSGWKFYIDGQSPDVGASSINVVKSMNIEWRYFKDDEPQKPEDTKASIRVRVEGNLSTLFDKTVDYTFTDESTPFDILNKAVGEENVGYVGENGSEYVVVVFKEGPGSNDGWSYCVKDKDGKSTVPMVGINAFKKLRNDKNEILYDEFVFYKSYYGQVGNDWVIHTKLPNIDISSTLNLVNLKVTDEDNDSPLKDVIIHANGQKVATTNSKGLAEFTLNEEGKYDLTFTRYTDKYSTLLKSHKIVYINSFNLDEAIESLRNYTLKQNKWNYEQALFYKMTGDSSDRSTIASKIAINNEIKNPTDLSGNIMNLIAADINPYNHDGRNYVAELIALQQSDGSFKITAESDNQTISSIIALDMADASFNKDAALSYLASKQKEDGSIGFGEDDTGMYLVALSGSEKYNSNRDLALDYLHSKQGKDGMINNAYSTAWAIHGLIAIGEDPSSASWTKERTLTDALMSHFEGDHFKVVSEWGTDISFISKQAPLSIAEVLANKSAYKTIRISSHGESLDVSKTSVKLLRNESETITAEIKDASGNVLKEKNTLFKLSDPTIASFDSSTGIVKGLKLGKCMLTVSHPENPSIKVDVNIEVVDKKDEEIPTEDSASIGVYGPEGKILSRYKMTINEGDDVMSFTKRALDKNKISYKIKDGGGYISAIEGLKEFQHGKNSGWKFYIDGKAPDVGADSVTVKDSMKIEWRYTKDYRKDKDYKQFMDQPVSYEEKAQKLVKKIDKLEKEELKERLKDITSLAGRLEREEDARILESALLDVAKEIQKENTEESKEIMDSIKKVYTTSLENFSTVKIDEDNKLDRDKVKESIKLMDNRYEDIQKKLEKANIKDVKLKKELVLDFSELDSKSVTIDSKASSALKDSTSESISIKTDDAKLQLKKDFFEDKDVKLEVKKINTKDHKKVTDRGSVIVDIALDKGRNSVSEFDQPIKISIPYKGIVTNPDLMCVYSLDEQNKTTKMGGIYNKEDGTITFETTHLSKYFAKVSPALLADSAEKAWAEKSIDKMAAKGILEGYDGKFNPSNNMTKAEFVTMTVRLVKLKSDKNSRPRFADVDSNAWYYKNIKKAVDLNLIEDASSSNFNPDMNINREEAAMIVFNALKARKLDTSSVSNSAFADASEISAASMTAVMKLRSQGLLKGDQNNNFNPKAPMTRAECAVFIDRLYEHMMNN